MPTCASLPPAGRGRAGRADKQAAVVYKGMGAERWRDGVVWHSTAAQDRIAQDPTPPHPPGRLLMRSYAWLCERSMLSFCRAQPATLATRPGGKEP